jgi:hypothetical protein
MMLNEKMGRAMAISDEEANQVIAAIEEAFPHESLKLGRDAIADLLQQWRAEIEAGRPIDRKLKVTERPGLDELAGVPRTRTSSTGEFVGKQDYRPAEQLAQYPLRSAIRSCPADS